jgi:hypothetical protein
MGLSVKVIDLLDLLILGNVVEPGPPPLLQVYMTPQGMGSVRIFLYLFKIRGKAVHPAVKIADPVDQVVRGQAPGLRLREKMKEKQE